MSDFLACNACDGALTDMDGRLVCSSCHSEFGIVENGVPVFDGAEDKESFFDKRAVERLAAKYEKFNRPAFLGSLEQVALWDMDELNKSVGITQKFWWEKSIGKIENKSILELGCGVNYIVPYWLMCGNKVVAFDICKENVVLQQRILEKLGFENPEIEFAVADAQTVRFKRKFDVVNISNVLHHIEDKKEVLAGVREYLAEDGKLLIVEPNYFYPPRWMIETDSLDPLNFVKDYFVRNDLIEKGEKAIIFSQLKSDLHDAGFRIDVNIKDPNYLGYFTTYWLSTRSPIGRLTYLLDANILQHLLPRLFAPFEFIIASKA